MERASEWVNDANSWGGLPCISGFCRYMSNWLRSKTLKVVICCKKSLFALFHLLSNEVCTSSAGCQSSSFLYCQVSFSVIFQTLNTFNDFLPFVVIRLSLVQQVFLWDLGGFHFRWCGEMFCNLSLPWPTPSHPAFHCGGPVGVFVSQRHCLLHEVILKIASFN